MKTFTKAFKITVTIVAALSLSAGAMNTGLFTKSKAKLINYNLAAVDTTVHAMVDVAPNFPGGIPAFGEYLSKNIKYPAADREKKISGKVFVVFIVEPDGSLSNFKAMRGPSETLNAEAIRVLASSPKWEPGKMGGKAVRVQYTVPINFALN